MGTLHLVNHASALDSCKCIARPEDTILLIEDAVTAARDDHDRPLLALLEDLAHQRVPRLGANVRSIDRTDFVELVTTHQPIVTWR
jgi:sulfur relay protein TusB/DsrH